MMRPETLTSLRQVAERRAARRRATPWRARDWARLVLVAVPLLLGWFYPGLLADIADTVIADERTLVYIRNGATVLLAVTLVSVRTMHWLMRLVLMLIVWGVSGNTARSLFTEMPTTLSPAFLNLALVLLAVRLLYRPSTREQLQLQCEQKDRQIVEQNRQISELREALAEFHASEIAEPHERNDT